jgi:predicted metal-dependent peptidase
MSSQSDRIRDIVGQMVLKDSFWGYLFSRVGKIEDKNFRAPAGVGALSDGMLYFFYNPDMIETVSDKDLETIIAHEGIHVLNKHVSRLIRILSDETQNLVKSFKADVWNQAADFNANEIIGAPESIKVMGKEYQLCHAKNVEFKDGSKLENGKTTEYYYYKLLDEADKNGIKINIKVVGFQTGKEGEGSGFGHEKWTEDLKNISDLQSFSRRIEQAIKDAVQQSLKTVRNRGNIPGSLMELINQCLLPTEVPYYQIIKKLVRGSRLAKEQSAYSKINRKRTYLFLTGEKQGIPQISPFPGKRKDTTFNISIVSDTSGSMSNDDVLESLKGIKQIIEKDKDCFTTVIQCDTEVQKEYTVKRLKDIDFSIKGRGGTTLAPGLFRAKELNTDVCLIFTDGYCDNINKISKKLLPKKMIWVLTADGSKDCIDKTGYIVRIPA